MTGVTGRFDAEVQWMPDRAAVDLATQSNAQRFSRLSKKQLVHRFHHAGLVT